MHMAIAHHTRKAGHPRQFADAAGLAHGHVIGPFRTHAEAPHGEARKTRARADQVIIVGGGHSLGFCRAVDIHELRENKFDVLFFQPLFCFARFHRFPPVKSN